MKRLFGILSLLFLIGGFGRMNAQETIKLSDNKWKIWLDKDASWWDDELFLPPVDVSKLPSNAPTVGWDKLEEQPGMETNLPATIEEYFWGNNGNSFGVAGNYIGVSWFTTKIDIPSNWMGKRIVLHFESARLRAEVYVNGQLTGYHLINGTPFDADISAVVHEGTNQLAVRITDPNGNFAWRDWETYSWGKYDISPSHGFGGITGDVVLEVTDNSYISDVYVKNKPQINSVDVEISLASKIEKESTGSIAYTVTEISSGRIVANSEIEVDGWTGATTKKETITVKDAKPWSTEMPELYNLEVKYTDADGSNYTTQKRFGFRYFEVKEVNGDRQFYLNGRRVVVRSAISWGHWPVNGIYPNDELARKQIETAKALGLNCLNFHRGIGQTKVLDLADELGLMYYEEPGGYRPGEKSEFARAFKRAKLLAMVKRDRSHPSLVIYNMINESNRDPEPNEIEDIQLAHKIDESRCITFTSTFFGKNTYGGKAPFDTAAIKMHMLPFDTTVHYYGWWDEHHAGGPGVYFDYFYNGPNDIYLHYDNPKEIIFLGEEGAIGTPPRLELIKKEYEKEGKLGWDGDTYLKMYAAYANYLSNDGFDKAFPTVDALTTSMGEISHYYQGRIIENCRVGNLLDGYVVNGLENTKVENHSGLVDIYRNPKTDKSIMAYYNQPLYVAVKMRDKVFEVGQTAVTDFYIINEKDVKGNYTLQVTASDEQGVFFEKKYKVNVTGGSMYGELLTEAVNITPRTEGYSTVKAQLLKGKTVIAQGQEKAFAVNLKVEDLPGVVIADTAGKMQQLFEIAGIPFQSVERAYQANDGQVLVVGADMQPNMVPGNFRQTSPIMDWVSRGNTMLVVDGADTWATYLNQKEILDYRGYRVIDQNWFGGSYFVKDHPFFDGLPVNTAFNWEYQFLAGYKRNRIGLRLGNGESVVGIPADHKFEVYDAVVVIPHGQGKIILSALDLQALIGDNTLSSAVAKRILMNYVKFGTD